MVTKSDLSIIFRGAFNDAQEITILLLASNIQAENFKEEKNQIIIAELGRPEQLWLVVIHKSNLQKAYDLITCYRFENQTTEQIEAKKQSYSDIHVDNFSILVTIVLGAFFFFAGPFDRYNIFFQSGAAIRSRIAAGEIWRSVTALCMHGDIVHLLGNGTALLAFGSGVCHILGRARGWLVILMTGITGNLLKVAIHSYEYYSIGASTSIFGAVGLLGGISYRIRKEKKKDNAWVTIAAATILLIFLSSSKNTDIPAHIYGFLSGLLFSIFFKNPKKLSKVREKQLTALFCIIIITSWMVALF